MEELLHSAMNQNFILWWTTWGTSPGSSPKKTSSATLRSRRMRRSRCLCGRSYINRPGDGGAARRFSPAFIPSYHPGSICAPGLATPSGHSRHIARKVSKARSLPRLERGLRRQHGPRRRRCAGPPPDPALEGRSGHIHERRLVARRSLTGRMCRYPRLSPDRATSTAPVVWLRLKWT